MEKKKISSLQWIYSYSRSSLGWILLLAVFSGLIAGSFILLALVSSCLLDIATGSREGSVWLQVLFLVMLILLQAVLNIASSNLRIRVTTKIEMRIKQGVFSMILKKQYQDLSDEKDKEASLATKLKDESYAAKYSRAKYYYSKSWEEVYTIPDLLPR